MIDRLHAFEAAKGRATRGVELRIRDDSPTVNPTLTLDEFRKAQKMATAAGMCLEDRIVEVLKSALK